MNRFLIIYLFFCSLLLNSCYTFSGASIHPEAKTIQIPTFPNRSSYVNPNLSQEFTIALQDRFIQRTKLNLTDTQADMLVSGEIMSYEVSSVNVQAGNQTNNNSESSAQNRLTMSVQVQYESKKEPEKNFQRTFSDYVDFEGTKTIDQAINELTPLLNKRLIDQIFNAIAVDW